MIPKNDKEGRILHLARYGLFLCLFQNGGFNHENKWTERLYRNMRTVTSLVGWLSEQEFVPSIACTRLVQDLLAPSKSPKGKNGLQMLMNKLPDTHKARWFAGAALNSADQAMMSVMSTVLA